jgi:hypothetical protein
MRGPKPKPFEERFWALVDRNGPVVVQELGNCWNWLGFHDRDGYGRTQDQNRRYRNVARISWELENGETIPRGYEPHHLCRNKGCLRPSHIEPLTKFENNSLDHRVLTEKDVLEIRQEYESGIRKADLARKYKVAYMTITFIVRRVTWGWL